MLGRRAIVIRLGALVGDKVTHVFKFKNTGQADLIIRRVDPTCGCTVDVSTRAKQRTSPGGTTAPHPAGTSLAPMLLPLSAETCAPGEPSKAAARAIHLPKLLAAGSDAVLIIKALNHRGTKTQSRIPENS